MERPSTSRPRGVCRYYKEPRGCFAGDKCKFLHAQPDTPDSERLTPYDQAKVCRYFVNGFCKHGDKCWFRHVLPETGSPSSPALGPDSDMCNICYDKPTTYGLLLGCSHIFCISCIRRWRDPNGKPDGFDNIKKCPFCRTHTPFITPSSVFWPQGHPKKEEIVAAYKESMKKIKCRYFSRGKRCPFGADCFYQHLNPDGTPYDHSRERHRSPPRRRPRRPSWQEDALFAAGNISLEMADFMNAVFHTVYPEGAPPAWNEFLERQYGRNQRRVREPAGEFRRVEELITGSLQIMEDNLPRPEREPGEDDPFGFNPFAEGIPITEFFTGPVRPPPNLHDRDDSDDESSNSSIEDSSPNIRAFDIAQSPGASSSRSSSPCPAGRSDCSGRDCEHMPPLQEISSSEDEDDSDEEAADDGPPFQTDGRGRVIAANEGQSLWTRMMSLF